MIAAGLAATTYTRSFCLYSVVISLHPHHSYADLSVDHVSSTEKSSSCAAAPGAKSNRCAKQLAAAPWNIGMSITCSSSPANGGQSPEREWYLTGCSCCQAEATDGSRPATMWPPGARGASPTTPPSLIACRHALHNNRLSEELEQRRCSTCATGAAIKWDKRALLLIAPLICILLS